MQEELFTKEEEIMCLCKKIEANSFYTLPEEYKHYQNRNMFYWNDITQAREVEESGREILKHMIDYFDKILPSEPLTEERKEKIEGAMENLIKLKEKYNIKFQLPKWNEDTQEYKGFYTV